MLCITSHSELVHCANHSRSHLHCNQFSTDLCVAECAEIGHIETTKFTFRCSTATQSDLPHTPHEHQHISNHHPNKANTVIFDEPYSPQYLSPNASRSELHSSRSSRSSHPFGVAAHASFVSDDDDSNTAMDVDFDLNANTNHNHNHNNNIESNPANYLDVSSMSVQDLFLFFMVHISTIFLLIYVYD